MSSAKLAVVRDAKSGSEVLKICLGKEEPEGVLIRIIPLPEQAELAIRIWESTNGKLQMVPLCAEILLNTVWQDGKNSLQG